MLKRLWCAVFHRRWHRLEPYLSTVKPFGGWRRVCNRCLFGMGSTECAVRHYTGPVEFDGKKWRPLKKRARDRAASAT